MKKSQVHEIVRLLEKSSSSTVEVEADATSDRADVPEEIRGKTRLIFILARNKVISCHDSLLFWLDCKHHVEHLCSIPWSDVARLKLHDDLEGDDEFISRRSRKKSSRCLYCITNDFPELSAPRGNLKIA